ncbi:hypothetical protein Tco_1209703 [Tanacetum coccineum]
MIRVATSKAFSITFTVLVITTSLERLFVIPRLSHESSSSFFKALESAFRHGFPISSSRDSDVKSFDSSITVIFALHLGCRALRNFLTTGYVFVLNRGVIDWKSTKQSIFAISSAEAEYIVASDASKEAVWVRKFIDGLGVVPTIEEPIKMFCDNTGAITIANESGITKGARHYHAKVHYLRKVIEYGDVKLEKVHTYDNLADPFTKVLAFPKHSEHTKNIGMLPASNLM